MKKLLLSFSLLCFFLLTIFSQELTLNWATHTGGVSADQVYSIVSDKDGNTYTVGYFENTVDFNPDSLNSFNLSSNGGNDHFALKLNQCLHSFDTLSISSCSSYISPSGKIWTQSGILF